MRKKNRHNRHGSTAAGFPVSICRRVGKHFFQLHVGVVIPLIVRRLFAELYGFPGAPLDAGKALLTMMPPDGTVYLHLDISTGAYLRADMARVALLVDPKALVHGGDIGKSEFIKLGKEYILP